MSTQGLSRQPLLVSRSSHYKTIIWMFASALPLFRHVAAHVVHHILRSFLCSSEVAFDIRDLS